MSEFAKSKMLHHKSLIITVSSTAHREKVAQMLVVVKLLVLVIYGRLSVLACFLLLY